MKQMHIALSFLLLVAGVTSAHDPYIEEGDWGGFDEPFETTDSAISYAMYGYLEADDIDVFALDFDTAEGLLRAQVLTPVCGEHYVNFYPQFIVFAPESKGIEALDIKVPFEVPEGYVPLFASFEAAAKTVEAEVTLETRPTFVEPFGGTEFYDNSTLDFTILKPGRYYVVVFNPQGEMGDYTLATGYREEFNSPVDQMLSNVLTIQSSEWLHRRCDLTPGDPDAIIEHQHEDGEGHGHEGGE
jgi:hypothetical protein